jgi:hypothetical protein
MISVPVGIQQNFRVPISDIDLDIVRCRWANSSAVIDSTVINECGDVCQNIPGAQLYSVPNGLPLSSIPLQCLVLALNISCNQPIIVGQLLNGATIGVEANQVFAMTVFAEPGCNTTFIDHFSTIIQPSGVVNISTVVLFGPMLYSIGFTWTPLLV